ncbi:2'-5' RNA ligase family protein [Hymenobacter sp. 102]|uniref:2'-5' RNA ligase family protein n=1 Tax=Hymenobacter sp. 102 TaxID=3403152 RepID=UPI003CEA285B
MTPASATDPLILTLTLDAAAHQRFTILRRQYFPPERNYLEAHVTLFHHLPGTEQVTVAHHLRELAATTAPLTLNVSGVQFLGRGVAYKLLSEPLQQLHRQLQTRWEPWLTPQDRQPLRPHITIQNKVDPARARALYTELEAGFSPDSIQGIGFTLWAYRGGPWQQLEQVPFAG